MWNESALIIPLGATNDTRDRKNLHRLCGIFAFQNMQPRSSSIVNMVVPLFSICVRIVLNCSCNLIFMTVIQFTKQIFKSILLLKMKEKKTNTKKCLHLKTILRICRQRFYRRFDSCSFDFRWPQRDCPIENLDLHFIDRLKFNDTHYTCTEQSRYRRATAPFDRHQMFIRFSLVFCRYFNMRV